MSGSLQTLHVSEARVVEAPDGSRVSELCRLSAGSVAVFELSADRTSAAVMHPELDEIWTVTAGMGLLWRKADHHQSIAELAPGLCMTIPAGTHFQFRAYSTLRILGVTMPAWDGNHQVKKVPGYW